MCPLTVDALSPVRIIVNSFSILFGALEIKDFPGLDHTVCNYPYKSYFSPLLCFTTFPSRTSLRFLGNGYDINPKARKYLLWL